jgi:hypothetical protein
MGMRKTSILKVLRERFPEMDLRDVRVVVGPGAPAAVPTTPSGAADGKKAAGSPASAPSESIEDVLARVPDEGLRRSLRALYEEAGGSTGKERRAN